MEGNQERLSSDDLSFWKLFEETVKDTSVSALFPRLSAEIPDDILSAAFDHGPKKPKVIPFIRRTDLNNDPDNPFEDNRPKGAWEIGIKVDF